jgi:hypothetical protein
MEDCSSKKNLRGGVEMTTNEGEVSYLNYLVRTYDGITRLIASSKQRLKSLPGKKREEGFDPFLKGEGKMKGLETIKGRISRAIGKAIRQFDIWELWLKKIPGIGPIIAIKLIILFNYRFIPVCKKCGGDLERKEAQEPENGGGKQRNIFACAICKAEAKDGLLNFRLEFKDFPTISKWWAYMGRHTVDGVIPKRKKLQKSNWSTVGRTVGFHIGEEFSLQKRDHKYKEFLLGRKEKHERNHSEWTKLRRDNAARNETIKLFLAHFWVVARQLDGKPVSEPYAGAIMGHTGIIKPFYWEEEEGGIRVA